MKNKKVSEQGLVISIVVSMLLWGLSWPSGKVLTRYCSAVNFVVYRYIIVVISLLFITLLLKTRLKVKKEALPSIIVSGLLLALYSVLFFQGLKKGAAGAGGVLVTTLTPIMAYVAGIILSWRLPSRNEAIGLVLGITAGSFLLKLWDTGNTIFESGNLFFLMAALTWAVMSKLTSWATRYGSSLGFSLWQYLITLILLLPLMDIHEFSAIMQINDPYFWWNLFFSSAIVTALATTLYFYATTRLGAEKASSFIFLVPLGASVSAWMLLGERIQLHTALGGVLGIAAVYMINKRRKMTV